MGLPWSNLPAYTRTMDARLDAAGMENPTGKNVL